MSYCHLFYNSFMPDEAANSKLRIMRDKLAYILSNDDSLTEEYALFRAIALNADFDFDNYINGVVNSAEVEVNIPMNQVDKELFIKRIAALIFITDEPCHKEDVIICSALCRKFGISQNIMDMVIDSVFDVMGKRLVYLEQKCEVCTAEDRAITLVLIERNKSRTAEMRASYGEAKDAANDPALARDYTTKMVETATSIHRF